MSITYDEILHEMETQFYNECGEYVKDYPEVELRFKAVASEIYAAHTAADFALKQAFVQRQRANTLISMPRCAA